MTGISIALAMAAISPLWSTQAPAVANPALPTSASVDRAALDRYVGTYRSSDWTAKVAVAKSGQLTLQINGLEPVSLIAVSEGQFRPAGVKATLVFHSDTEGVSHFVLHREGTQVRATRKRPKPKAA